MVILCLFHMISTLSLRHRYVKTTNLYESQQRSACPNLTCASLHKQLYIAPDGTFSTTDSSYACLATFLWLALHLIDQDMITRTSLNTRNNISRIRR